MMSCFQCCMSEEKSARKSLKKSIKEYHDTKTLASFANISFKTGKFFFNILDLNLPHTKKKKKWLHYNK